MYLCVVTLPLWGFLLAAGAGRWLGGRGAALLTTGGAILGWVLCCVLFYEVALCGSPCFLTLAPWVQCELFDATWGFWFDSLTVVMLVVVTSVSTLVHLYSWGYMAEDPHLPRFLSYLSLFTFFMVMLVTGDNFLQLFFGWEGVGLASYLLINFWFTRLQANKAALKAMVMNRVGDVGLALGVWGLFTLFGSVEYSTVFACAARETGRTLPLWGAASLDALDVCCLLLFVGAVGKSAQLGLHTWLPDAMEGPTPVSALIHAATMVTAGVFLLARCSPLLECAPQARGVVALLGALTAFFAATAGVVQNDLKRVIAYSTCSQLGYMVFACGLSHYDVGVFHLANHAFFKALLFLGAGCVIHAFGDEQDLRRMGGALRLCPLTYSAMLLGSLALVGFPFLAGFYSKDAILEVAWAQYNLRGSFAYVLGTLSAGCTAYYSLRLLVSGFGAAPQGRRSTYLALHEAPWTMGLPLVLLAGGSLTSGYLAKDMMLGVGTDFWHQSLYQAPGQGAALEAEYLPQGWKLLPLGFTLGGAALAGALHAGWGPVLLGWARRPALRALYGFLNQRWLVDRLYNAFLGRSALAFGHRGTFRALDRGVLAQWGPLGLTRTFRDASQRVAAWQTGYVYHYALILLLGLTALLAWVEGRAFLAHWVDPRLYLLWAGTFLLAPGTSRTP
uniref:NADH-ubiquinone oxidoreductase chain 5 n=1 Tax=Picocystis salinarum TaxID=88271 RepID=A0A4D6C681_9CHLO|nr:NADH dehydrogenase subunit 5 [Picocystis salinarum]QBX98529.1 NADH dehydrogenase subunit 5 [Picocystis salinarum]